MFTATAIVTVDLSGLIVLEELDALGILVPQSLASSHQLNLRRRLQLPRERCECRAMQETRDISNLKYVKLASFVSWSNLFLSSSFIWVEGVILKELDVSGM
jgi:hypothetical protein